MHPAGFEHIIPASALPQTQLLARGPVPGPGINYTGPREA